MSRSIAQDLLFQRVQNDLSKLEGVKKSLVASRDGYMLSLPAESNTERYALASAAMLRTADAAIQRVGKDCSRRIVIDYPDERLIATRAGPKALIAVLAGPKTGVDSIFQELDKAAEKVRGII